MIYLQPREWNFGKKGVMIFYDPIKHCAVYPNNLTQVDGTQIIVITKKGIFEIKNYLKKSIRFYLFTKSLNHESRTFKRISNINRMAT